MSAMAMHGCRLSALHTAARRHLRSVASTVYGDRYTVYGTAVDERDATVTGTVLLCAPGLYTIHCIHFRYRPCVAVLRAAVPTAHCSSFLFVECRARCGSCDVSPSIVMRMY
jgi:hypothetical protein